MRDTVYELTNPQKSIWYTEQFYENSPINNISGTLLIHEVVNFDLLKQAINLFVQNNESVRFNFKIEKGNPIQFVQDFLPQDFLIYSVASMEELSALQDTFSNMPIDTFSSSLFSFKLVQFPDGSGGFDAIFHHLICDAWSMSLLINEIMEYYAGLLNDQNDSFSAKPSYTTYIEGENNYIHSDKYEKDKNYWDSLFPTIPELVSFSLKTPAHSSQIAKRSIFPLYNSKNIDAFCKENHITPFNFLIAIYAIYLYRVSGSRDIIFGVPVLNRSNFSEKETFGMFINTLPLKISIDQDLHFLDLIKKISEQQFSLFRHHKYSYIELLRDLRSKFNLTQNLYDTMFSFQNARDDSKNSSVPYSTTWNFSGYTSNSLDIHVYDMDNTGTLNLYYDYQIDRFNEKDIANIHNRICTMIDQFIVDPSLNADDIRIVTKDEQDKLLHRYNDTQLIYPKDETIHQLFEKQVQKAPNKIAIVFENSSLTYEELDHKSNQLAHFLKKEKHIQSGDFIGIMVNRSLEMAVGLLAILKAGATYIPIDPEYPQERIAYMIEDSGAKTILVDCHTQDVIPSDQGINIDLSQNIYQNQFVHSLENFSSPSDLMYLIYTSGSTGKPKGVMLTHQNINNYIHGLTNAIDFSNDKVMVSVTTICFDIFVTEFWASLSKGLTVVLANEQQQNIARDLNQLCLKNHVNMIQTTPSRLKLLLSDGQYIDFLNNLTDILVGGEPLPVDLLSQLKDFPNLRIYNMYGPTETAVWSTIKENPSLDKISIGRPIANTKTYVLDEHLHLLPPNIPGKLYIGGDGVSKGYHHRLDLTQSVFVKSPFDDSIIYNTNDLAYISEEGELYHLGRADFQVKIHGFRIELGEIENVINDYPNIKSVVVIAEDNMLNAFIVSDTSINTKDLIQHMLQYLPHYMIPKNIIPIDTIPLTPNGKVDRKNVIFKNPCINTVTKKVFIAPHTEYEKILQTLLSKELHKNISIDENFFELGIDSLMIIKIISKLYSYKINLSVQDFYNFPTIEILASKIGARHNVNINQENQSFLTDISSIQKNVNVLNDSRRFNHILLTGSTGFLGVHILADLLDTTDATIYCLVRSKDGKDSKSRLLDRLNYYFDGHYNSFLDSRIIVIDSNIQEKNFGLTDSDYSMLKESISSVIHCAADVRHFGSYDLSRKINVDATNHVIDFCLSSQCTLNYISTMTVSGYGLVEVDQVDVFDENSFYIGQHYEDNIYVKTKFLAEQNVFSAIEKGLIANIYRIGNLTNCWSDGRFQFNSYENAFMNRLRIIKDSKALPNSLKDMAMDVTCVDLCAKAIVKLSLFSDLHKNINVFHLYNPHLVTISQISNFLKNHDILIDYLGDEQFKKLIISQTNNINSLSSFITEFDNNSIFDLTTVYSNQKTCTILSSLGFEWPTLDERYINILIKGL